MRYMAPELIMNQPYRGESIDLFAAGVILFTMVSLQAPFQCAAPSDEIYKFIAGNKSYVFWNFHCKATNFSKEVKELIIAMIQYDAP